MLRWLVGALLAVTLVGAAPGALAAGGTATITGTVVDAATGAPIAGVDVFTTDGTYDYTDLTDSGGSFTVQGIPAGSYTIDVIPPDSSTYQRTSVGPVSLSAGQTDDLGTIRLQIQGANGALTGKVTDGSGAGLPGMTVDFANTDGVGVDETAVTGAGGTYAIVDVPSGTYAAQVFAGDTKQPLQLGDVTVGSGAAVTDNLRLPDPVVPGGTSARNSARDLAWLNKERVANGLPGGIILNQRWSTDCAAHDAYEHRNNVETHYETSGKLGYSVGGAWAGKNSIIAPSTWKKSANPWEPAPIHLAILYAPSLSVVGIDDSRYGWVCTTAWVGMQKTFASDMVSTYPGNGDRNVDPGENAHEFPFVPGQFVGIPEGTLAGRELFVYLNQAGRPGQAQVKFVSASLTGPHGKVAIKTVDNSTKTVGTYLAGGVIIPVKPLAPHTTYTGDVTLVDGSGTISHTWHFTTGKTRREIP